MQLSHGFLRNQRGVGLIEVLIAVLVLSFGMLGLVGLQTWALRNNQSALERGMATVQTHTIVDAMRASRDLATSGGFDIALADATPAVSTPPAAGDTYRDVAIATWRAALQATLNPTATGSIDCNGARCTIVIQWSDARAGTAIQDPNAAAALLQLSTEVEL